MRDSPHTGMSDIYECYDRICYYYCFSAKTSDCQTRSPMGVALTSNSQSC